MALTKVNSILVDGAINTDSSGNVGIGTTTPVDKFSILSSSFYGLGSYRNTNVSIAGAAGTGFSLGALIGTTPTAGAEIGAVLEDANSGYLSLATRTSGSLTAKMRITSDGDLALGTTTTGGSTPGKQIIYYAQNLRWGMFINETTGTATAAYAIAFGSTGTLVGRIQTTNSSTTYVTSSDYRLKENIAPMTGALDKVALLKPVTYKWKLDGTASQGFIAHELAEVVPEAVAGEKNAIDENGKIVPQGIDTSFLVATLTAAIQELNAKVDAQALEITALKAAK
jgi:hypothetical protein